MMIKTLLTLTCLLMAAPSYSIEYTDMTYEWLVANDNADYLPHFRKLFNAMKVRTLMQCGCNYSTKYFLERTEKVVTVEFMHPGASDKSFLDSLKVFKKAKNWTPVTYNSDLKNDSFNKACAYQCATHRNYALVDSKYVEDLDFFFKGQIEAVKKKNSEVDVAFIKTNGIVIRGDLANLFLYRRVPVVVVADTNSDEGMSVREGLYGLFKIYTPPDYEKVFIPYGAGTTFWINKYYPAVLAAVKKYRDRIVEMAKNGTLKDPDCLKILADEI